MINSWQLRQATRHLKQGGIIAYPTEAVYGLGCDPFNPEAVMRLLALKQRVWQKGLIVIAADYAQLSPLLEPLTPELEQRVFASYSHVITWLLPARPNVPYWLRGESSKLAVRITTHSQAAALCREWGGVLVSTSANLSGKPPCKTAWQVRQTLGNTLDYLVYGKIGGQARPSEIRDALTNKVLRA